MTSNTTEGNISNDVKKPKPRKTTKEKPNLEAQQLILEQKKKERGPKENSGSCLILIIMIIAGFLFGIGYYPTIMGIIFILMSIILVWWLTHLDGDVAIEEKKLKQLQTASSEGTYENWRKRLNLPGEAKVVTLLHTDGQEMNPFAIRFETPEKFYIWKQNGSISIFPYKPQKFNAPYSIQIESIHSFYQGGEIYRENRISGGGGGGSSLGGAVVGGLIAGGAGAIIGSRKQINGIKSELITHDERETILKFDYASGIYTISFQLDDYRILNSLIPEKSLKVDDSSNSIPPKKIPDPKPVPNSKPVQKNVSKLLRELAALKEDGIITETEFNEKKKILLEKIN